MMTEQELEEALAKRQCELDGWNWDDLPEVVYHLYGGKTKSDYRRDAQELMPLIKANCHLRGRQAVDLRFVITGDFNLTPTQGASITKAYHDAGWKPCTEWSK